MKNLKLISSTFLIMILVIIVILFLFDLIFQKSTKFGREPLRTFSPTITNEEHFKHHNLLLVNKDLMNKPALNFELKDINDKIYSLKNFRNKNVILFFNEGVMCYPSCWQQIIALAKDKRFKTENTVIFSIIVDTPEEWQQAIQKMPELNQAIALFDIDKSVSKNFGMLNVPSSMHPGLYPGHSYVIIDQNGIIRYVLDDPDMGIRNDLLLQEIQKINNEGRKF